MSSNSTASASKFERMTKEEKLRFCQELIKQAANLKNMKYPKDNVTGNVGIHSKSKRSASTSGTLSKKTKNGKLSNSALRSKSGTIKGTSSKSSVKSSSSHTSQKSKSNVRSYASSRSPNKTKQKPKHPKSPSEKSNIRLNIDKITVFVVHFVLLATSVNKSMYKSQPTGSQAVIKSEDPSGLRLNSPMTGNKSDVFCSTPKSSSKSRLDACPSTNRTLSNSPIKSPTKIKSKGVSSIQSSGTKKTVKSSTKKMTGSSFTNMTSQSSTMNYKTGSQTQVTHTKSKLKSSKAVGKKRSKHSRLPMKDHTEACGLQFVPKFNPNSNKNQVPIYHLIRHAFGNMVRESICQLDKEKSGVSTQQIIDHILKHYAFPNNISESSIRNRAMFTINSGLRAGTLLTVSPNKSVRIGRVRRNYSRIAS